MGQTQRLVGLLLLSSCGAFPTGRVVTETRAASGFAKLDISSGFVVTVGTGDGVTYSVDEAVLPFLLSEVRGDTLFIGLQPGTSVVGGTRQARVGSAVLAGASLSGGSRLDAAVTGAGTWPLQLSGGSQAALTGFQVARVEVDASGGSTATLTGTATTLSLIASGGSTVNGGALSTTDAVVELSGGSEATVRASGAITGAASGGSTLVVQGTAVTSGVALSGGSEVRRR
jgi:hypothetical protein